MISETNSRPQEEKKKKNGPSKTEMSIERTVLAQERTLAAWVRTNASFITFGFAIYKLLEARAEAGVGRKGHLLSFLGPKEIGLIMFATGFIGLLLAVIRHYQGKWTMEKLGKKYFSISLLQAYVMLALSALMIIAGLSAEN